MPRAARVKGVFSTYHIIQRGNERKPIFLSDADRVRFLDTLEKMRDKYHFILEAYCLMDNHVHLVITDNGNDISKIIKSINVSYAYYFNNKHNRVGHLFQDRFISELIESDRYLLAVSAYIHNNPVKAGMIKVSEDYRWSSFGSFLGKDCERTDLVEQDRILGMMSEDYKAAVNEYYRFVKMYKPECEMLDVEEDRMLNFDPGGEYIDGYESARKIIDEELEKRGKTVNDLKKDMGIRMEMILRMRRNSSLTLKEIGDLCGGVSQSMICKMLKADAFNSRTVP